MQASIQTDPTNTQPIYQTNFEKWIARDRVLHPMRSVEDLEIRLYFLHQNSLADSMRSAMNATSDTRSHCSEINDYHKFTEHLLDPNENFSEDQRQEMINWIKIKRAEHALQDMMLKDSITEFSDRLSDINCVDSDYSVYQETEYSSRTPHATSCIPSRYTNFEMGPFDENDFNERIKSQEEFFKQEKSTLHKRKRERVEEFNSEEINRSLLEKEKNGRFKPMLPDIEGYEDYELTRLSIKRRKLSQQEGTKELEKLKIQEKNL